MELNIKHVFQNNFIWKGEILVDHVWIKMKNVTTRKIILMRFSQTKYSKFSLFDNLLIADLRKNILM